MKTQNIAADLPTLLKEQTPQNKMAVEKFQAAMKTFTKSSDESARGTMSEGKVHSGKKDEAENESALEAIHLEVLTELEEDPIEDEAIIWFNMGNFRLTETFETKIPVLDGERIKNSDQLSTEGPLLDLSEVNMDEMLESMSMLKIDEIIRSEEFIQVIELSLQDDTNLTKSVEGEGLVTDAVEVEKNTSLSQSTEVTLTATEEVEQNVFNVLNTQQLSEMAEDSQLSEQVILTEQLDAKGMISTQSLVNEGRESVESNLENQEPFVQLEGDTEIINNLGIQVEVEDQDVSIKTETKSTQPTEMTQVGQLNQLRILQSNPQVESVKVVSQEQWVQEVETFIVDELDGSNTVEKVTTTRIQLTPKHLGEMEIELVIKDKGLTARLVVEEMETKQWLEQKLMQLTNSLATQEIKVEEFHIVVANNERKDLDASFEGNSAFKQRDESSEQKQTFHKGVEEEPVNVRSEQVNRSTAGRLSMWV